jgi:hypothetical protein
MSRRPRVYHAAKGKFGYLLIALLVLLLTAPLVTEGMLWTIVLSVFATMLLVAALHAVKPGRFSLILGVTLAAVDFGIGRIASIEGYRWLLCLQAVLWMVTLGYVTMMILEHVLGTQPVTLETLQAAFCVFLLLGLVWTYFYIAVELINPGSFESAESVPISWSSEGSSRNGFLRFLIMSYATISARDYEGLGPSRDFASICNCLESIMAQVYLAVIVARLVGLQVSDAERVKESSTS